MNNELDSLNLKEIIGFSIDSEDKSTKFYKKFVESGKGKIVQERFKSLMEDEKAHKKVLLDLNEKIFGDKDYKVPKNPNLPKHEDFENLKKVENIIEALEKAINNEYNAIRIYEYSAKKYVEHSSLFEYLAAMEHGHYKSLNKEKELYEKKPDESKKHSLSREIWKNLGLKGI